MQKYILYFIVCLFSLNSTLIYAKKSSIESTNVSDSIFQNVTSDSLYNDILSLDTITPPEERYSIPNYIQQSSYIGIPVKLNGSKLQKIINESVSDVIYQDSVIDDDGVMALVRKTGEIKLRFSDDTMKCTIPLDFKAKVRLDLGLFSTDQEANGAGEITLATSISIDKDWNLKTSTKIDKYKWTKSPAVKVAGMDIPVTYAVDKVIKKNKGDIEKMIDQALSENVSPKQYAEEIWREVQNPIPLSASGYSATLCASPERISCTPIELRDDYVSFCFGITTKINLYDSLWTDKGYRNSLPSFDPLYLCVDSIHLEVPTDIPFAMLDSMITTALAGTEFTDKDSKLRVGNISLYGNDNRLVVAVGVDGTLRGTLYVECDPYYDIQNKSIGLRDAKCKFVGKGFKAWLVGTFFRRYLKSKIEAMTISLNDQYYMIKELGRSEMFDREIGGGFRIDGDIQDIIVKDIFVCQEGIRLIVDILGKIHAKLE